MAERPIPPADITPGKFYEEWLPARYQENPDAQTKLKDVNAIFQFNIEGEGGGNWSIILSQGSLQVQPQASEKPNCTISMAFNDWKALIRREIDPQMAFMSGKIRFAGDMNLAMKLGALLRS